MLVEIRISPNDAGQRAERFLRRWFPLLSTGRLQSLFRRKEIKVLKKPIDTAYLLKAGDVLQVFGIQAEEAERDVNAETPRPGIARKPAKEIHPPPPILYEDHELLVVNKPSGMAAHPGSGIAPGASLIERVQAYLAAPLKEKKPKKDKKERVEKSQTANEGWAGGEDASLETLLFGASNEGLAPGWGTELFRPALVHRLDKETSGALLIAKSGPMLRTLTEALRDGKIRKRYLALVAGHPKPASGTIDAALARVDSATGAKSLVAEDEEGKASLTRYKTIKMVGDHALLQVVIETGRMHQIRAHLSHIGHPIAGDTRYGNFKPSEVRQQMKELGLARLFLHAEELSWKDGETKRVFQAPLPEDLGKVVGRA
jgi:23S rRNA pseudouridine955/2504/2580 synthase